MKIIRKALLSTALLFLFISCGGSGDSTTATPVTIKPFITTWQTDSSKQVTITTQGSGYNYAVDWGDGNNSLSVDGNITHTYVDAGVYTVKIIGDFPQIYNPQLGAIYESFLQSIEQWGEIKWSSMKGAFQGEVNLVINVTDNPDLSNVTDLSQMFSGATNVDIDIGGWDVSTITNMTEMFKDVNLSTDNYDSLLNQWSQQTLQNGVVFDAGGSKYRVDFNASRQSIIDNFGWTISDGGVVEPGGGGGF